VAAVERSADGRSNPMVNAGALAAVSLVPGGSSAAKWLFLRERLSAFAGRDLALSDEVYASASATNHRNRAIADFLASRDRIYSDPAEAVDLYTRQSCLLTSVEDLAVMSATLADGGGQSGDRAASGHPGRLPACARGHGHRRDVRDLGRLAF
jgi:glutaminase